VHINDKQSALAHIKKTLSTSTSFLSVTKHSHDFTNTTQILTLVFRIKFVLCQENNMIPRIFAGLEINFLAFSPKDVYNEFYSFLGK
jgi:hypothetical protein